MPRTHLNCKKCRKEIPAHETKQHLAVKSGASLVPANRSRTGQNEVVPHYFHPKCAPAPLIYI